MTDWQGVDHVQLCVPEGEDARGRATRFYTEVLGFDALDKPDSLDGTDSFWFGDGGVEIHLGPEAGTERSRRHPAFVVDDLEPIRDRLEDEGIETRTEPPIPGRERFSFRDPFGNRIECIEYED
ncbi:VOC family protein [Halococcus hamelinensis]|uniref:Glyoxalase/bleomycin resistance protein/dioxygenase n=1 Tax=Halococcus hamelinensis 100A6 TaxID=1132509 RepID=M0M5L5_9EURY|nr:VOC family protein [Halococcus hamelinensis]EMA39914.1 glyoxalase/bleomycin resistance protein/dioxygenase [Halococcus hamelinensis 100A6]